MQTSPRQIHDAPPPTTTSDVAPVAVAPEHEGLIDWTERRSGRRVDVDVDVTFESESNFYQGFAEDMSDGGLFIATYELRPIGSKMDVELTLPNGHIIRARAEVRWLRDLREECADVSPGMGLAFVDLFPEDVQAIREFIASRSPLFYDDDL